MTVRVVLALSAVSLLVACGGENLVVGSNDGGDGGSSGARDASKDGSKSHMDGGSTVKGGGAVDAGYYYGDGSFWVEGGAYKDFDAHVESQDGSTDASIDASPGCATLAACCPSLVSSSQSVCNLVASQGNASECSTELGLLEGEGSCTGVTVVATEVQQTPTRLVSDGTLLYWSAFGSPSLFAMPVGGGPITILLEGGGDDCEAINGVGLFLAVDDVNIYVYEAVNGKPSLVRLPKNGSPSSLLNERGVSVHSPTTLGGVAYWLEGSGRIASAPLQGNTVTFLWAPPPGYNGAPGLALAVTSSAAFVLLGGNVQEYAPLAGPLERTPSTINLPETVFLSSDESGAYCSEITGMNSRIANDGTVTSIGPADSSSYFVFDETYAYWANLATVGTIMRVPKAGGAAVTLATDTNPTAIAVDANSVYWANTAGDIKSLAK
jgi:hypothetical protein